jgi:hypothetical protein
MTWVKRVQPSEKLLLKLSDKERALLVNGLPDLPAKCTNTIKRAAQAERTLLTLPSLHDLSMALATALNCSDDEKVRK